MEKNWEEEQSQHGKEMARRGIGWGIGPAGAVRGRVAGQKLGTAARQEGP